MIMLRLTTTNITRRCIVVATATDLVKNALCGGGTSLFLLLVNDAFRIRLLLMVGVALILIMLVVLVTGVSVGATASTSALVILPI